MVFLRIRKKERDSRISALKDDLDVAILHYDLDDRAFSGSKKILIVPMLQFGNILTDEFGLIYDEPEIILLCRLQSDIAFLK